MQILEKILCSVNEFGDDIAIHSKKGELTYNSLWELSDKLAKGLEDKLKSNKKPIVVYGHKDPLMLLCFLACVKSGRAYCPVDISMPKSRVEDIIKTVDNELVLALEDIGQNNLPNNIKVMNKKDILKEARENESIDKSCWVKPEDTFYIIFTSGSTGAPKGVEITSNNLSSYTNWSVTLGDSAANKKSSVFMNQAPFSFDLSVMDLYTSLVSGGKLYCIDKSTQQNLHEMLNYMEQGKLNYWISTPSFADMCLADDSFNNKLLKKIKVFLFCGEKLTLETARKLRKRFPDSIIVNTYGPTESTVAVTQTVVTNEMLQKEESLPIGKVKPGSFIKIIDEHGKELDFGKKGEIQILGDTVSIGYFNNLEKTKEVFGTVDIDGKKVRTYNTGDEGYIIDGMLYYCGRIDFQVKLHGYRIELGDIESNLIQLDGVEGAAVIPKIDGDRIRYLVGMIVSPNCKGEFSDRKRIRTQLKEKLPDYMVPKKIVFLDKLPMTNNGKTDRRKLEEYL